MIHHVFMNLPAPTGSRPAVPPWSARGLSSLVLHRPLRAVFARAALSFRFVDGKYGCRIGVEVANPAPPQR